MQVNRLARYDLHVDKALSSQTMAGLQLSKIERLRATETLGTML
ncbi:MAG: hypothetical protein ACR2OV_10800 [Hyphomicrobiaceae bacterium]